MKRAIFELEQLSDNILFETLSEGKQFIVDNAESFNANARRLYQDGEFRASEIMCGFADEETAKVLIVPQLVVREIIPCIGEISGNLSALSRNQRRLPGHFNPSAASESTG